MKRVHRGKDLSFVGLNKNLTFIYSFIILGKTKLMTKILGRFLL